MKVKILTRNPDIYLRDTKRDVHKVPRNYDPSLHPFEAPREYTRAVNAVKLERVFAKPFVGNLDGHIDGITCLDKHPASLSTIVSGDYGGEVRLWDLTYRRCKLKVKAHDSVVRGVTFSPSQDQFITAGQDKTIKIWPLSFITNDDQIQPTNVLMSQTVITGISHHKKDNKFATCGDTCQLWDESRSEPFRIMEWGCESLYDIAFNPIETCILASCTGDRGIILYDTRMNGPIRKLIMKLRTNKLAWNPMEAYTLSAANEDYNVYTYDTRNFRGPVNIHKDHVSAVTCIDYAPTGKELVTGSYDKSIRIFETNKGHSRDIYHTKRMQHVTNVCWSLDNKFIISTSDEMNVRIWKARASEKLGVLNARERSALEYNEALKQKFGNHPQIKRIARHRQIPRHIYHSQQQLRVQRQKITRKEGNRRKHSKPGTVPFVAEREKNVVTEYK